MLGPRDFEGRWQITREITDRQAGQSGRLAGVATLTQQGVDRLLYAETGTLTLGDGAPMVATRRYQWHFRSDSVEVTFEDGAPFHSFAPAGYVTGTEHLCGEDTYRVRYDFIPWPRWRSVWIVTGPRKDYTSITEFIR
ncbi:DUF6314 family protein [Loktanella agnita]|uniref:DUF6314 family protein n=1 Tax=Loktanella agnita TaxID=287097 RepID=UPI003986A2BF